MASAGVMPLRTDSGLFFFFQAEDGIRALYVTGVQTCALPISQHGERLLDDVAIERGQQLVALRGGDEIGRRDEAAVRSEERRVGKECRSRGSPYHEKEKTSGSG